MVAGKVKQAMGLTPKPDKPKPKLKPKPPTPPPPPTTTTTTTNVFNRSLNAYFPRTSSQVQPRPPEIPVTELLKLVDELRDRESRLKTELLESKLLRQSASIIPALEAEISDKTREATCLATRVSELEAENERLIHENHVIKLSFQDELRQKDAKIVELLSEIEEVKQLSSSQRFLGLVEVANKSTLIKNLSSRKLSSSSSTCGITESVNSSSSSSNNNAVKFKDDLVDFPINFGDHVVDVPESSSLRCRIPRIPKPPPKRDSPTSAGKLTESVSPPPPPPPPPPQPPVVKSAVPKPPPPPPVAKKAAGGGMMMTAKVKRVPEVVEFYHSLMRRDSRRESGGCTADVTAATNNARDLVGEIENRSAYLIAIKTDVETQGDFIRFLIKEVETAAFTDIEDVVSFVKWLDDELSYLVDERAVLKHFDWPEQKADALREAAFEYSDLKKLECEASSFRHDARQACSTTLKKMQTLLEKLEHGAYNLSRLRESATNRFKSFHIPVDWMLDTGFVSQIKLASVKLAMKYMKRVLAELEVVGGGPEEEELIVQGVRFAFRVHQFAGGFDVETMTAFEELRDKARSYHVQSRNQQQERLACRSMPC